MPYAAEHLAFNRQYSKLSYIKVNRTRMGICYINISDIYKHNTNVYKVTILIKIYIGRIQIACFFAGLVTIFIWWILIFIP